MEVSGDTHAVTLGAGGTAGTLGSGGTAGTGEARSASNARSTLGEADEAVREQHGPSSRSRVGGEGHSRLHPWHRVDHQHRGCPVRRKRRRRRVMPGPAGHEAEGQGAVRCHLQQDQQRQQGRGGQAHHGHPGDLHCHEHPGDRFHPGEEEEGGRGVSARAALKPLPRLISPLSAAPFPWRRSQEMRPWDWAGDVPACPAGPGSSEPTALLVFSFWGHVGNPFDARSFSPHQLPVSTSFSQPRRCHLGAGGQAGPTLAPAAPGKPGGPAGPVGP